MTTATATYAIGIADLLHAIPSEYLTDAGQYLRTACGDSAIYATEWGEFRRGNPHLRPHRLCQHCAWTVALANDTVEEEIAAAGPSSTEQHAWGRLMPDPDLIVRTVQAILAARTAETTADADHPRWAQMLGHLTAHRPELLTVEDCAEGSCDHDDEVACYAEATIGCPTCSVKAGPWAGEWEGQCEVLVPAPCSVLVAMDAEVWR